MFGRPGKKYFISHQSVISYGNNNFVNTGLNSSSSLKSNLSEKKKKTTKKKDTQAFVSTYRQKADEQKEVRTKEKKYKRI